MLQVFTITPYSFIVIIRKCFDYWSIQYYKIYQRRKTDRWIITLPLCLRNWNVVRDTFCARLTCGISKGLKQSGKDKVIVFLCIILITKRYLDSTKSPLQKPTPLCYWVSIKNKDLSETPYFDVFLFWNHTICFLCSMTHILMIKRKRINEIKFSVLLIFEL